MRAAGPSPRSTRNSTVKRLDLWSLRKRAASGAHLRHQTGRHLLAYSGAQR